MSVLSLMSVKGAPGVTTTCVALTRAWPGVTGRSAVLFEADEDGGDCAAGVLRASVTASVGVMALASFRSADARSFWQCVVGIPADEPLEGRVSGILPGIPDSARTAALPPAWSAFQGIRDQLSDSGCDLIVDAGRVGGERIQRAWLRQSDLALLVVEPTLPQAVLAHRLAQSWPSSNPPLNLVVVHRREARARYSVTDVGEAVGLPVIGGVAADMYAAAVNSEGTAVSRRYLRSRYRQDVAGLASELVRLCAPPSAAPAAAAVTGGADIVAPASDGSAMPSTQSGDTRALSGKELAGSQA